jgi:hypothetical protein
VFDSDRPYQSSQNVYRKGQESLIGGSLWLALANIETFDRLVKPFFWSNSFFHKLSFSFLKTEFLASVVVATITFLQYFFIYDL